MAEADNNHLQPAQPFRIQEEMLRVDRLIVEGLEVALHLINAFIPFCGPNKLIDILKQLLPTAYFLSTSYWPFYETEHGHSLCVCKIFGFSCTHMNRSVAWINIEADTIESYLFKTGEEVFIKLVNLEIDIVYPKTENLIDFKAFKVILRYKIKQFNDGPLSEGNILPSTYYSVLRCSILNLTEKIEQFCFWFNPHPATNPIYGRYFNFLKTNFRPIEPPVCYIVDWKRCPNYTAYVSSSCTGQIEGPVEEFNVLDIEHDEESVVEKNNNDESDVPRITN